MDLVHYFTNQLERGETMRLQHSSISNLLLLPKQYHLEKGHEHMVSEILISNKIFKQLYELEGAIQPTMASLEARGLVVSGKWFENGMRGKANQLEEVVAEINHYIGGSNEYVDQQLLNEFWVKEGLPKASTTYELNNYKNLHPIYYLMLKHNRYVSYVNQWGYNLRKKGIKLPDGNIRIKGKWLSFSSHTGRITAKQLPLTSLPKVMREYIVAPEGTQLFSIDLSNAELRFLALYANCEPLMKKFSEGIDVHSETAMLIQKQIGKLALDEKVTRELAKTFTYSYLYGAGPKKMLENFRKINRSVTYKEVMRITAAFNQSYPELENFLSECEDSELLLTPFGLVKPVAKFTPASRRNFSMQSSVSVALKLLMLILTECEIKIHHVLHDEVWVELPKEVDGDGLVEKIAERFGQEMTKYFEGFPLKGLLQGKIIGG